MTGSRTHAHEQLKADPRYGSKQVSCFVNAVMSSGKKSAAQRVVYDAFDLIEKQTSGKPSAMEVFERAILNVRPDVEVRSRRVGGANYQVPMHVSKRRQQSLAFRWVLQASRSEKGKPMAQKLAKELMDAYKNEGKAVTTKDQTHRMADANRAFAHFAW